MSLVSRHYCPLRSGPQNPWPHPLGNPLYPLNIKECMFDYDVALLKNKQTTKLAIPWDTRTIQEEALDEPAASLSPSPSPPRWDRPAALKPAAPYLCSTPLGPAPLIIAG